MTIFFDGACPLCAAEIHMLAARNQRQLLKFVDLSEPGAELPCNIVCARAMDNIHGLLDDGSILVGVPVFAEAYRRADLPVLGWLLSRPRLRWLLDPAYAVFARHRGRISAVLGPPLLRFAQYAWR